MEMTSVLASEAAHPAPAADMPDSVQWLDSVFACSHNPCLSTPGSPLVGVGSGAIAKCSLLGQVGGMSPVSMSNTQAEGAVGHRAFQMVKQHTRDPDKNTHRNIHESYTSHSYFTILVCIKDTC